MFLYPLSTHIFSKVFATGGAHVLVLKKNGELWGWGYNSNGQLGTGDIKEKLTEPRRIFISSLEDNKEAECLVERISFIGCGWDHLFVVLENGDFYSWSGNTYFQTGHPESRDYPSLTKKEGFKLLLLIQEALRYMFTKWDITYMRCLVLSRSP
jgi:alpha-tubulin suppressor-like RCC1 family protein